MIATEERTQNQTDAIVQKLFFQVFLSFKKPDGYVSMFLESTRPETCNIYHKLAQIFDRPPREMYECLCSLADGKPEAFMQEYLSLDDASQAVAQASLFAHTSCCVCFIKQEGYFHIKEVRR